MRLKSEIWVQALLRRNSVEGRFGAVLKRGAEEAGAVYVVINHLDGRYDLLGPPPGPAYDDEGQRRFERLLPQSSQWPEINTLLERRRTSDPDIWIVEIEDRQGLAGLAAENL